ncbi:MAG: DUF5788 family protein [Thermoplasmata archaeon]
MCLQHGETNGLSDEVLKTEIEKTLQELERPFAFVGAEVPAKVIIDGVELRLSAILWQLARKKNLDIQDIDAVVKLIDALTRKKKELLIAIRQSGSRKELEKYKAEAFGIIRAISEFSELTDGRYDDFSERDRREKIEDAKRWLEYLKQIR